jgi:hypothetical protein
MNRALFYLHVAERVSYTLRVVDPVDRHSVGTAALQLKWHVAEQRAQPSSIKTVAFQKCSEWPCDATACSETCATTKKAFKQQHTFLLHLLDQFQAELRARRNDAAHSF